MSPGASVLALNPIFNAYMNAALTIDSALRAASAQLSPLSPTARLDAELLLANCLKLSRAQLLAELRSPLPDSALTCFQALLNRRLDREPLAYLLGRREFYGLELLVSPAVLVPRPETELLVDRALALLPSLGPAPLLADIGTGSAAIAVALASRLPKLRLYATDLSAEALQLAAANLARHGLSERVQLLQGDLCSALPEPVDLLISNPPYTLYDQIDEGVRRHEPRMALDGGPDGLVIYRRLIAGAPAVLRSGGAVLLEIGAWQAHDVSTLLRTHLPAAQIQVYQDLAGHDRVIEAQRATGVTPVARQIEK